MKMNVCYITVIDRVIKYFVYPHINAMIEEGNEVTCISNFSDINALDNINGDIATIQLEIERNVDPINLISCIFRMYRIFRAGKYDVIQYTGPSTALICSIAGCLAHIPVRQYCLWGIRYEGFNKGLKRRVFRLLEKISCKLSTHIILDSENNRKFAVEEKLLSFEKSTVIGLGSACGVDLSEYDITKKEEYRNEVLDRWHINRNAFVFGYVGRLSAEKGFNELLRASMKLISNVDNVVLLLVGFEENNSGIDSQLLIEAKKTDRIIFCGRVDAPQQYYAAMDVFVFPSYREGYGGGCVQAGAFAVPSIVSDIRPLMDAIQEGKYGEYFKLGDWYGLYEKMYLLYSRKDLLKKYGEKMYSRVKENFEMEAWKTLYKQHMERITGKKHEEN